ncbi:MAG TPA: hypothetical protein VFA82_08465 [Gaiellaceae bacterium]|nr:hypothetical protein [Gaiellaceae bacterium]
MLADALNSILVRAYLAAKREDGQTFVEYSLIGVVVAVLLVTALGVFRGDIVNALNSIGGAL